jgi:hypothetical protein
VRWKNNGTLALVIGWIGMMKFTGYEAQGIEPLVTHSPLLSWMYGLFTVCHFAAGLRVVEICIAILIALRSCVAKSLCNWRPVRGQTQSEECVLVIFGGGAGSTIAAWTFAEEGTRVAKNWGASLAHTCF